MHYDKEAETIYDDPMFCDILTPHEVPEGELYWRDPENSYISNAEYSDTESVMSIDKEMKLPPTPKTALEELLDAEHGYKWYKSMWEEVDQLLEYGTFRIVQPTEGEYIASMKMCLQPKIDNDMTIRYKARLVL